jgi:hypothetical protein
MMFDTNASIRFLVNEMDPSERLLFERELERNPDLLIELETLRNTMHRLDAVPLVSAPESVLTGVKLQAATATIARRRRMVRTRFLQAAAVATLALVPAIFFASRTSAPGSEPAIATGQGSEDPSSPWIDRNETLRLAATSGSSGQTFLSAIDPKAPVGSGSVMNPAATLDSMYEASLQKLRPLTGNGSDQSAPARVQLARTTQR